MRIRVFVDVRKPLCRGKKINVGGDNVKIVRFKYERLSVFCYLCGVLGHMDNSCDLHFELEHDDGSRGWGPELKVERRNPGENNSWLRKEGGAPPATTAPVSPAAATGQAGRQGNNGNINSTNYGCYEDQFQFLSVHNDSIISVTNGSEINGISNHGTNQGIAVTISTNYGARNSQEAAIVRNNAGPNPVLPRGPSRTQPRILARNSNDGRSAHACMDVDGSEEEDLRKRKRLNANILHGESSTTRQQTNEDVPFLSAGPGSQACQE